MFHSRSQVVDAQPLGMFQVQSTQNAIALHQRDTHCHVHTLHCHVPNVARAGRQP